MKFTQDKRLMKNKYTIYYLEEGTATSVPLVRQKFWRNNCARESRFYWTSLWPNETLFHLLFRHVAWCTVSIMVVCVGARHQDRDLVDQCQRQLWSTGTFFLLLLIPQRSFSFNRGSQNHDYDQCSIGCAALLCFRMKTNATAVLFWSNGSLVLNHYWAWGTVQIYQL